MARLYGEDAAGGSPVCVMIARRGRTETGRFEPPREFFVCRASRLTECQPMPVHSSNAILRTLGRSPYRAPDEVSIGEMKTLKPDCECEVWPQGFVVAS